MGLWVLLVRRANRAPWVWQEKTANRVQPVPLEAEVQRGHWDFQDQRVWLGTVENLARQAVQGHQAKGGQMERTARRELQVQLVHLDLLEREENRDLRASMASKVCQDNQAHQESRENQEMRVWLEKQELLEQQV